MWAKGTSPVSFVIDPQRDGIENALWKEVTPTIAVSGGKFRFNAAEGLVRADIKYARVEIPMVLPLTTGQNVGDLVNDIEFGLKNLSLGTKGSIKVLLDQSAGNCVFTTCDNLGDSQTTSFTISDTVNAGEQLVFVIEWFNDRIRLNILEPADLLMRVIVEHRSKVGSYPLNPFISVVGAEDVDVPYIVVDNAHQNSIMLV